MVTNTIGTSPLKGGHLMGGMNLINLGSTGKQGSHNFPVTIFGSHKKGGASVVIDLFVVSSVLEEAQQNLLVSQCSCQVNWCISGLFFGQFGIYVYPGVSRYVVCFVDPAIANEKVFPMSFFSVKIILLRKFGSADPTAELVKAPLGLENDSSAASSLPKLHFQLAAKSKKYSQSHENTYTSIYFNQ